MGMRVAIKGLAFYPRTVIYKRDGGKTYQKITEGEHIEVQQKGRFLAWTPMQGPAEAFDPEEIVEIIIE